MKHLFPPTLCLLSLGVIFARCSSSSLTVALLSWVVGGAFIYLAAKL